MTRDSVTCWNRVPGCHALATGGWPKPHMTMSLSPMTMHSSTRFGSTAWRAASVGARTLGV